MGDETLYSAAPTVRSNVWPESVYYDAVGEIPQTGSLQSSTSTKTGSASGVPDRSSSDEFLSAQTSIASDFGGVPDPELDVPYAGGRLDLSSESGMGMESGSAAEVLKGSVSSGSISSMTTIGSDLADMPNLEAVTSDDDGGHVDLSSESSMSAASLSIGGAMHESVPSGSASSLISTPSGSQNLDADMFAGSGHLDISSISSGSATLAGPAQEVDPEVEEAYKKAEGSISAAYWNHGTFKDNYSSVKEAMANAGSVDVSRLGSLLAREEQEIRSAYGSSKWKSVTMDHAVDSYTASTIHNKRGSTLSWIKSEQRSMGLLSKRSSFERLGSWASKAFSRRGEKPDVPEHLLEAIAEDDEAKSASDDEGA